MSTSTTTPFLSSLEKITGAAIGVAERGLVPDAILRAGIRKLCADRLKSLQKTTLEEEARDLEHYVESLRKGPLAIHTREANTQHYEVPSEFYVAALGKNLKYSSCYYSRPGQTLDQAEDEALAITCERAELAPGQKILELGCGWGSLTLTMARRFPTAQITAISNSATQRQYILKKAEQEGLKNVEIITHNLAQDIDLGTDLFDRVVSVEMFEHFKNYEILLERVSRWLKPEGKLFVHIFTHRQYAYPFEIEGESNWMGRNFFSGGQMPSHTLLLHFQKHLGIERLWQWDGTHYAKTADHWLENQDRNRTAILDAFRKTYGEKDAEIWFNKWRIFFMACSELFGYDQGREWGVTHLRFVKKA